MRANARQQGRDVLCAGQLDLTNGERRAGEEFRGLALERVQREEAEEIGEDGEPGGAERLAGVIVGEGFVEGFDDEVLGVGAAEAVEIDEEVVPRDVLLVAAAARFHG